MLLQYEPIAMQPHSVQPLLSSCVFCGCPQLLHTPDATIFISVNITLVYYSIFKFYTLLRSQSTFFHILHL